MVCCRCIAPPRPTRALGAKVAILDVVGGSAGNSDGDELMIRDESALREVLDHLRGH